MINIQMIFGWLHKYVIKSETKSGSKDFMYPRPQSISDAEKWLGKDNVLEIFHAGYDVKVMNHYRPMWVKGESLKDGWVYGSTSTRKPETMAKKATTIVSGIQAASKELSYKEFALYCMANFRDLVVAGMLDVKAFYAKNNPGFKIEE